MLRSDDNKKTIIRSSKGKMYWVFYAIGSLTGIAFILISFYHVSEGSDGPWIYCLIASLAALYGTIAAIEIFTMYVFERDGIKMPRGNKIMKLNTLQKFIPYSKITKFYHTGEAEKGHVPARPVWVSFVNEEGKEDGAELSAFNNQDLIRELTKRTGMTISADPDTEKK